MKALLVCARQGPARLGDTEIAALDARLRPDNLTPRPPRVSRDGGIVSVLFNAPEQVESHGVSACIGTLHGTGRAWSEPGSRAPDGSFALLRASGQCVELVADAVGSRTLWYVLTEDLFAASTSQRAIASVIGGFEPDRRAFAWMLSSGTLGPGLAWDTRVRSVPPGGRVRLDRAAWRIDVDEPSIELRGAGRAAPSDRRRLEDALEQVFRSCVLDTGRWVLPLSGGVDSRGVLLFLENRAGLETVTWGVERSLADPRSDGRIAERLAGEFGLAHRFIPIAVSQEPRDRLIERFLVAGEGRTDRLSGYLDGFAIWRSFAEQGYQGVIRGDEAFGWNAVHSEADVLRECGVTRLADVLDDRRRASFGLPEQTLPPRLERRVGESLAAWRDRLYQQFRLPVLLAALTDLKSAYVEVANPLLSSSVIECVRTLPDGLRTDKRLWLRIVTQRSPAIPFATRTGVYPLRDFVREPATLELMLEELGGGSARGVLGDELAGSLRAEVERVRADVHGAGGSAAQGGSDAKTGGRAAAFGGGARAAGGKPSGAAAAADLARAVLPVPAMRRVGSVLRRAARALSGAPRTRRVEPVILAFRAFLIARTVAMLESDAAALRSGERRPRAREAGESGTRSGETGARSGESGPSRVRSGERRDPGGTAAGFREEADSAPAVFSLREKRR